ncbi:5' nucleotidase, NT5C type [Bacillus altitudinis]|uniref:5' nucleotidase, NT5C type n=1 Tax=Bacillus altitudinis TaxID=293387 RepID=UPI002FFE94B4
MKRKVIAIDMDDVLADFLPAWVKAINQHDDPTLKCENIKSWNISDYVNTKNDVFRHLTYDFFKGLSVKKDSQKVVKNLCDLYEVYVVTTATAHPESLKAKLEWLQENFPFISHDHVVLCGNKKIIKADYMIDDGIHNLETFEGVGMVFDAPHNENDNRFLRVKNWLEIGQKLRGD